ncbi:hypothetical protein ATY76_19795 [Rhizobium sp. R339]|nr:hypothetical protein ATY76_19795 [Rhizobium sp. R339]
MLVYRQPMKRALPIKGWLPSPQSKEDEMSSTIKRSSHIVAYGDFLFRASILASFAVIISLILRDWLW